MTLMYLFLLAGSKRTRWTGKNLKTVPTYIADRRGSTKMSAKRWILVLLTTFSLVQTSNAGENFYRRHLSLSWSDMNNESKRYDIL